MNKITTAKRSSKAISTYSREANVQRQIADKMIHLLQKYIPSPCPRVVGFGCGMGIYSRMLLRILRPEESLLNDLCPEMGYRYEDLLKEKQISFLPGDAETISFPGKSTLITSCSVLQRFESLEEFSKGCNILLHSQGYFTFNTFGKKDMKEMHGPTGKGLSYRSEEELETTSSFHSGILYSEEELIPLSLGDPMKVPYHLKQAGVNGLSAQSSLYPKHEKQTWTRHDLQHFCKHYTQGFTQGTSVSLTYHPTYIITKKKKVRNGMYIS